MSEFVDLNNRIITDAANRIETRLRAVGTKSKTKFKFKTKTKTEKQSDKINTIGISMVKHAIFKEKGVGRGRGIDSGKTTPDPIINPTLEQELPLLADQLGENYADLLAKSLIR